MPPSVTCVTLCPLGTEWLLISANCLWVQLRPLCALPLQLGDTTTLLQATPRSTRGDTVWGSPAGETLLGDNGFSAARCGDASRVPRQLSFRRSSGLWLHRQPWETLKKKKKQKSNMTPLYRTCSGTYTKHTHRHTHIHTMTLSWLTNKSCWQSLEDKICSPCWEAFPNWLWCVNQDLYRSTG